MKNILAFCVAFIVISAVAFAGPVDILFTGDAWKTDCAECDPTAITPSTPDGITPQGMSAVTWNIGNGFTLTIAALVWNSTTSSYDNSTLWWDSTDGFGVNSTIGYEPDEVEFPEVLAITVNGGTLPANSMHLTDLYNETRDNFKYLEEGFWSTAQITTKSGVGANHFFADPGQVEFSSNGEETINLGVNLGTLYLSAPGYVDVYDPTAGKDVRTDNEYSIAGLNLTTSVPVPSTMALLGIGLLVGAVLMKRSASF